MRERPSGTLLHAAAELLKEGPVHTLDLAREVMGLSGHQGAASAAVFSLLGSDPRFSVDGDGTWRLKRWSPDGASSLQALSYAVVDVETTGGSPGRGDRITEVAVVEIRGGVISEDFQTLVNPGRVIPPRVSQLTGITNEMVESAPFCDQVAEELARRLEGRVFVAHNVSFDWGFIANEMVSATGEVPEVKRLCTVKMARRLVPGLRRRNLDSLTSRFGIDIQGRHRAFGDALATARVFLRLLDEAALLGVTDMEGLEAYLAPGRRYGQVAKKEE